MTTQHATFAAGCFWGVEDEFKKVPGVLTTEVGYTGGATKNPTYDQVCSKDTAHAEAVHITFDDKKVTYNQLLDKFWDLHDPTTMNRQGPDVGSQYRSAIFTHSDEQEKDAKRSMHKHQEVLGNEKSAKRIVTQIVPAPAPQFYRAEEYHQCYLQKRGGKRFGFFGF